MDLILKNPYRIVGILVGSTAREQERQIKRLKKFIAADQPPDDDFSFPVLGKLNRTDSTVDDATSKLNLNIDKVNAALFWFFDGNTITDEPAFNEVRQESIKEATSIWGKLVTGKEISSKNASAFFNWGTLFLNSAFTSPTLMERHLEKGLNLKLRFLESSYVNTFIKKATDETFSISKISLQLSFLNLLLSQLEKSSIIATNKLIEILFKIDFSAKDEFLKSLTLKPIAEIEAKVERAKSKRKLSKSKAADIGDELYYSVNSALLQIKSILGDNNLKFSSVSDKVSSEILQCGIDYFKHFRDTNTDPGGTSMALFQKANQLAIGGVAKQRCEENTQNLQEWIDEKPEREKQSKIIADFEALTKLIDSYENKPETVANAKAFLTSSKPYLLKIKNELGRNDEVYLGVSTRVASDTQSMLVGEINKLQSSFSNTFNNDVKRTIFISLKSKVEEAWGILTSIGAMDLRSDFRTRYNTNKTSLSSLRSDLAGINTNPNPTPSGYSSPSSSTNTSQSSGSGCYIATMAYGDYDHPQVLELRKFRDEVLDRSVAGRIFIKYYYILSPRLVTILQDQKRINAMIKKTLNQLIKLIN